MRLLVLLMASLLGCAAAAQAPAPTPSEPKNPDERTVPNLCIINTRDFLVRRSPEYLRSSCEEYAAQTRERLQNTENGLNLAPLLCWYSDECSRELPLVDGVREVPVR